jgi:hypothetical protein
MSETGAAIDPIIEYRHLALDFLRHVIFKKICNFFSIFVGKKCQNLKVFCIYVFSLSLR